MPQRNTNKIYILLVLLAVTALLIFFNSLGWLAAPKNIVFKLAEPVLRPFQVLSAKISRSIKFVTQIKNLAQENSRLKKENESLAVSASKLAESERENQFLRAQLSLFPPLKLKLVLADIIGFEPENFGEYFLINQGNGAGVSAGQAVIYADGFLVGRISETGNDFAKAMALVDSASSIFVLSEETRISGAVKGDHGVGLILDMVPLGKEIKISETIVSSGLDSRIPRGLIIGKVAEKVSENNEVFQRFKIKPAVNYKEMERVFIIIGNE